MKIQKRLFILLSVNRLTTPFPLTDMSVKSRVFYAFQNSEMKWGIDTAIHYFLEGLWEDEALREIKQGRRRGRGMTDQQGR